MDTLIGVVIIVIIVAAVIAWSIRSNKKRLAEVWSGKITKRWVASYTDDDGNTTHTPMFKVDLDGGKSKKISVSQPTYDALKEGDKIKKEAGQKDPVKA